MEKPNDMDRMVLCDVNRVKENEMCKSNDFDSMNPNEIQNDAMNIQVMSIKKYQKPFETRYNTEIR